MLFLLLVLNFSANAQCWKQLDAGGFFTVGIKEDGTLWGWGNNWSGVLGNVAIEYHAQPVQMGTGNDWKLVSAGLSFGLAIKQDGTLWGWGRNDMGQIGNGQNTSYPNPVPVQIGTDQWIYASGGQSYSAGVKANGTLWTWGDNLSGQLGNGLSGYGTGTNVPVQVGTDTNWKYVYAGYSDMVGIKTDGTLWRWGGLGYGTGTVNNVTIPQQVGTDSDWDVASVGGFAVSALKKDGTLWSWGYNGSGGVGNGTFTYVTNPVQIAQGRWKSVKRGKNYFAGAIREDGTLWTWGYNYYGSVGDGTTVNRNSPVLIASNIPWESFNPGGESSFAIKSDGTLMAWGTNFDNELGFGLQGNTVLVPTQVDACAALSVNQISIADVIIYPNPVSNELNIMTHGLEVSTIGIYDVSGKIVLQATGINTVNTSQLAKGMYIAEISSGEKVIRKKFIKE